jgi:hypothetical protein
MSRRDRRFIWHSAGPLRASFFLEATWSSRYSATPELLNSVSFITTP